MSRMIAPFIVAVCWTVAYGTVSSVNCLSVPAPPSVTTAAEMTLLANRSPANDGTKTSGGRPATDRAAVVAPDPPTEQDPPTDQDSPPTSESVESDDMERLHRQFEQMLSGTRLLGRFTIVGQEDGTLHEEEYILENVTKMEEGNLWRFQARIRYGGRDVSVPLPLEVQWAGDTPMITLTNFTIPGLGTYSARVLFHEGKYAGTWSSRGEQGGHLFGRIEPLSETDD